MVIAPYVSIHVYYDAKSGEVVYDACIQHDGQVTGTKELSSASVPYRLAIENMGGKALQLKLVQVDSNFSER
jgi:hypothetical protein